MTNIKKTRLGKTNLEVSQLGFGAAPIGLLKAHRQSVSRILNLLLDAGVNLIDTAAAYGGSEELIAEAVGHRRNQYVLVSKCGRQVGNIHDPDWSPALIAASVDRSLQNLGVETLDVMLLHSCEQQVLERGEALGALVKARQSGKIRFAGYSGDNQAAAYAATLADIAVIETSISIADQANIDAVLPLTRKNDIGVLAKRPIANAAWRDSSEQPGFYASYAQDYHDRLKAMNLSPADLGFPAGIAAWPEIALRFTLSQNGVNSAIIGTTNPDNARQNLEYAAKGPLPAETVEKIRSAFKKAEAGKMWEGLT
jgi:aryl-alcohol dehydrogenase-like predicted oxidoreductase